MWDSRYNWCFHTDPEPGMNSRQSTGRVGGAGRFSSINGLICVRGQHEDYERGASWATTAGAGTTCCRTSSAANTTTRRQSVSWWRRSVRVTNIAHRHELIEAFVEGAESLGIPRNDDFNGAMLGGAGYFQLTTHKGLRSSAATSYLKPARRRPNLRIETGAYATKLLLEGRRVTSISYRQDGRDVEALLHARGLAGGGRDAVAAAVAAIGNWPVGGVRAAWLARARVAGIGENLQDRLQIRLIYECTQPFTTNDELRSLAGRIKIGLQWLFAGRGPLAVGIDQGSCFMRALPSDEATPDIQFHVATLSADMAGGAVHPFSGFTLSIPRCSQRLVDRRDQVARSNATAVDAAPLSDRRSRSPHDDGWYACGARHRAIRPMRQFVRREVKPGPEATSDNALLEFARNNGATIFHPSGTCKMGKDPLAVVDPRLRVHGSGVCA